MQHCMQHCMQVYVQDVYVCLCVCVCVSPLNSIELALSVVAKFPKLQDLLYSEMKQAFLKAAILKKQKALQLNQTTKSVPLQSNNSKATQQQTNTAVNTNNATNAQQQSQMVLTLNTATVKEIGSPVSGASSSTDTATNQKLTNNLNFGNRLPIVNDYSDTIMAPQLHMESKSEDDISIMPRRMQSVPINPKRFKKRMSRSYGDLKGIRMMLANNGGTNAPMIPKRGGNAVALTQRRGIDPQRPPLMRPRSATDRNYNNTRVATMIMKPGVIPIPELRESDSDSDAQPQTMIVKTQQPSNAVVTKHTRTVVVSSHKTHNANTVVRWKERSVSGDSLLSSSVSSDTSDSSNMELYSPKLTVTDFDSPFDVLFKPWFNIGCLVYKHTDTNNGGCVVVPSLSEHTRTHTRGSLQKLHLSLHALCFTILILLFHIYCVCVCEEVEEGTTCVSVGCLYFF